MVVWFWEGRKRTRNNFETEEEVTTFSEFRALSKLVFSLILPQLPLYVIIIIMNDEYEDDWGK